MKKTISLLLIPFILVGCGEKNEEYYLKNIDSAEKKVKQCENDLEKAFKNDNEKEFLRLADDPECKAARKAINTQKQLKWEAERKLEEENKRKAIEEAKSAINSKIKGMGWQDSITEYLKTSCVNTWSYNSTPECDAWNVIYEEKVNEGNQELSKLSFDELINSEEQFCSKDKRKKSPCEVWEKMRNKKGEESIIELSIVDVEKANPQFCEKDKYGSLCSVWKETWNNKSKQLTKFLVDNYDEFKKTYNMCYEAIEEIKSSKGKAFEKSQNINEIKNMTPCQQASDAYRQKELGWGTFDKAID